MEKRGYKAVAVIKLEIEVGCKIEKTSHCNWNNACVSESGVEWLHTE